MGAWFILVFALYVVAEWFAASWLAGFIGWLGVVVVVALFIIVGSAVMRRAGRRAARSMTPTYVEGVGLVQGSAPDPQQVARDTGDAGLLFLAGALIALPGLLTSALGLVLLVPPVRRFVGRRVSKSIRARAERAGMRFSGSVTTVQGSVVREDPVRPPRGEILSGEIVRDDDDR
jgi:UPF0716 protein FxsA